MNNRPINHFYRQARFLTSAASIKQLPGEHCLEVAFAGRSNAGKSSAINVLCDNKSLAKTSRTPGRTRLINLFALDQNRRLVDLPGYGYAKVPLPMKQEWEQLMTEYLQKVDRLKGVVVIMDIRHPMKEFDLHMLNWCAHFGLPAHVLLTKADKLKKNGQQKALFAARKQLKNLSLPASIQVFSALSKAGLNELVAVLDDWLEVDTGL